jgi:integrase/recombinase XerC
MTSRLLDAGADLRPCKQYLGHTNLNTTGCYLHVDDQRLTRAFLAAHPRATGAPPDDAEAL